MIVTLKTLKQHTFKIEIEGSDSVRTFKERIESQKGHEFPANCQKLIYAGKILNDENKMSEYDIDEKKFVVIMVTKPLTVAESNPESAPAVPVMSNAISQPSPAAPLSSSAISTNTSGSSDAAKSSSGEKPSKTSEEKPPEVSATESSESNTSSVNVEGLDISAAESTLVLGEDYQKMVSQIMEMGYVKDDVERALRASFNNPDRAVEYLISGSVPSEQDIPDEADPAAEESNNSSFSIPTDGEGGPLAFLRTQPQFQQIRQVIQQNPQLLNTVLQQIGQNNPQLLQLISQNQEAFVRMINEPAGTAVSSGGLQSGTGQDGSSPSLEGSLAHATAHVTPQDKEAIERLKALGFPEYLVVQAYFACDKNENLAANFLLSQNFED